MQRISPHISYAEAVKSQTAVRRGIDNTPSADHLKNMEQVALVCFEPLRAVWGRPIAITSFYRCPALNRAIKGSKYSQHCKGEAIDLDGDVYGKPTNVEIFYWLKDNVAFDQLIWEFGTTTSPAWVHVSHRKDNNRRQVLRALHEDDVTRYIAFDLAVSL